MSYIEIYSAIADDPSYMRRQRITDPEWSGEVRNTNLEAIFRFFNRIDQADVTRLEDNGYRLPSLSVGDVIHLPDEHRRVIVCPTGFADITEATYLSIRDADDPASYARKVALNASLAGAAL